MRAAESRPRRRSTRVLIRGWERGERAAVDAALGGRQPLVAITAVKEFLRGGGSVDTLRTFLVERGGRVGAAATSDMITGLQSQAATLGRALRLPDAAVLCSAVREGVPLITADTRLLRFINAAGYFGEPF